jgi:hypothetical protein
MVVYDMTLVPQQPTLIFLVSSQYQDLLDASEQGQNVP